MGFLQRLFHSSRQDAQDRLFEVLLQSNIARTEADSKLAEKRMEAETRKLELEVANLETIESERRKNAEHREHLRTIRREALVKARAAKKQKAEQSGGECRVCTNPQAFDLTADEILYHANGHRALN